MKRMKGICYILVAMMAFTSTSYGATLSNKHEDVKFIKVDSLKSNILQKEEIIKIAKGILKLGANDDVQDINFSTDDTREKKYWSIDFENKVTKDRVYMQLDAENGELLSYKIYKNGKNYSDRIVQITEQQARDIANKEVKRLFPEIYGELIEVNNENEMLIKNSYPYHSKTDYDIEFVQKIDGEYFSGNNVSVNVDGTTGEITRVEKEWFNVSLDAKEQLLNDLIITRLFKEQSDFELEYIRKYDNEHPEQYYLIPIYKYVNHTSGILYGKDRRFLESGEIYQNYDFIAFARDGVEAMSKEKSDINGRVVETVPEKGVMSKEAAEKIVLNKVKQFTTIENFFISSSYYSKQVDSTSNWHLYWSEKEGNKYISATVDAKTGNITRLNYSEQEIPIYLRTKNEFLSGNLSKQEYDRKMKNMLQKGDINQKEYEARYKDLEKLTKSEKEKIEKETQERLQVIFSEQNKGFKLKVDGINGKDETVKLEGYRYFNNIPYKNNYLDVIINPITGNIESLSLSWNYNVLVEPAKDLKTDGDIEKIFFDKVEYRKSIIQLKDQKAYKEKNLNIPLTQLAIAYNINNIPFTYLDAKTGEGLNYSGQPYTPHNSKQYVRYFEDLDNAQYGDIIAMMNKMGFVQSFDTKFNPSKLVTREDAIKWITIFADQQHLGSIYRKNILFDDVDLDSEEGYYIKRAIELGIVDGNETAFRPKELATKLDIIKWTINGLGQKDLAQFNEIFIDSKDENIAVGDNGYIALAKYYNIFGDDEIINFNDYLERQSLVKEVYELLKTIQ